MKPAKVKKLLFLFTLAGLILFFGWLVCSTVAIPLPDSQFPIRFYSNQHYQNLKLLFCKALQEAEKSIFIQVYGLTDPDVISLLENKAAQGIPVTVYFDASASSVKRLKRSQLLDLHPVACEGLMHKKILVIDGQQVFLGSANLTTQSLKMHDNFVFGLHHPVLAEVLMQMPSLKSQRFELPGQCFDLFFLPDKTDDTLKQLEQMILSAKKTVRVAMFTLTHPRLIEALCQAKKKNVDVRVAVDFYTARGASRKGIETLAKAGVPVAFSRGNQLLHHKWAYIDEDKLISGSANWTKAAFNRNQDCFLVLDRLNQDQKKFMNALWKRISLESQTEICYKGS